MKKSYIKWLKNKGNNNNIKNSYKGNIKIFKTNKKVNKNKWKNSKKIIKTNIHKLIV